MENRRGQGALEYLILIGAAMVVVILVIAVLIPNARRQQCENDRALFEATCSAKAIQSLCMDTDVDGDGTDDCDWQSNKCVVINTPITCS